MRGNSATAASRAYARIVGPDSRVRARAGASSNSLTTPAWDDTQSSASPWSPRPGSTRSESVRPSQTGAAASGTDIKSGPRRSLLHARQSWTTRVHAAKAGSVAAGYPRIEWAPVPNGAEIGENPEWSQRRPLLAVPANQNNRPGPAEAARPPDRASHARGRRFETRRAHRGQSPLRRGFCPHGVEQPCWRVDRVGDHHNRKLPQRALAGDELRRRHADHVPRSAAQPTMTGPARTASARSA